MISKYEDIKKYESKCKENAKIIVSKENNSIHRANNIDKKKVYQYKVDGDIYEKTSSNARVDYLVINEDKKTAYLIELKGSDLEKAMKQLQASKSTFSKALKGFIVYLRIIFKSGTHGIPGSKMLEYKRSNPNLIIKTTEYKENI